MTGTNAGVAGVKRATAGFTGVKRATAGVAGVTGAATTCGSIISAKAVSTEDANERPG